MRLCCEPIRIFRFAELSFLSCIFFFVSAAFASSVYHEPHIVDSYACFALCEVGMIGGHMRCPVCGHPESKVVDSRPSDEFNSIRRRRECLKCGNGCGALSVTALGGNTGFPTEEKLETFIKNQETIERNK